MSKVDPLDDSKYTYLVLQWEWYAGETRGNPVVLKATDELEEAVECYMKRRGELRKSVKIYNASKFSIEEQL